MRDLLYRIPDTRYQIPDTRYTRYLAEFDMFGNLGILGLDVNVSLLMPHDSRSLG